MAKSPADKCRLRQISDYNVSTVRDSFPMIDGVRTLPLSLPKGGSKTIFCFLIKFNFTQIKSAAKFFCVKTSSGRVVA